MACGASDLYQPDARSRQILLPLAKPVKRIPGSVRLALFLVALIAAFWIFYAVIVVLGLIPYYAATSLRMWIMTGYAVGISTCLAGTTFLLYRRSKLGYFLSGPLLVILAVLTIADQFGLPDLVMLLAILLALGLIVKERRWFLDQKA